MKYRMWLEHTESYHPPKLFGDKNWSLWIKGEKVTKDVRKRIIEHIQGTAVKKHISRTDNIPLEILENIDWDSVQKASKNDNQQKAMVAETCQRVRSKKLPKWSTEKSGTMTGARSAKTKERMRTIS